MYLQQSHEVCPEDFTRAGQVVQEVLHKAVLGKLVGGTERQEKSTPLGVITGPLLARAAAGHHVLKMQVTTNPVSGIIALPRYMLQVSCQMVDGTYNLYIAPLSAAIIHAIRLMIMRNGIFRSAYSVDTCTLQEGERSLESLEFYMLSKSVAGCDRHMGGGNTKPHASLLPSFLPSVTSFEICF